MDILPVSLSDPLVYIWFFWRFGGKGILRKKFPFFQVMACFSVKVEAHHFRYAVLAYSEVEKLFYHVFSFKRPRSNSGHCFYCLDWFLCSSENKRSPYRSNNLWGHKIRVFMKQRTPVSLIFNKLLRASWSRPIFISKPLIHPCRWRWIGNRSELFAQRLGEKRQIFWFPLSELNVRHSSFILGT